MIGLKPPLYGRSRLLNLYQPKAGDGCVLWLPGQDDAYSATIRDRSGLNNNGTITGATWARTGKGLWYLSFDGIDDYATIPAASSLEVETVGTLEVWTKADAPEDLGFLLGFNTGGAAADSRLSIENGGVWRARLSGGVTAQTISWSTVTTDWVHLLVTWDSTLVKLFTNGIQFGSNVTQTQIPELTGVNFIIAKNVYGGTWWYEGKVGVVRLYNRALTPAEIQNHYQQERHFFGV